MRSSSQQRRSAKTEELQARTEAEEEGGEGADHLRQETARQQQSRARHSVAAKTPSREARAAGPSTRQRCRKPGGCAADRWIMAGRAQKRPRRTARAMARNCARSRSRLRRATAAGAGRAGARVAPLPRDPVTMRLGASGGCAAEACVASVSSRKATVAETQYNPQRRGMWSVPLEASTAGHLKHWKCH